MEIIRRFLDSDGDSIGDFALVKKDGEYLWEQRWYSYYSNDIECISVNLSDKRLENAQSLYEIKRLKQAIRGYEAISGSGVFFSETFSIPFLDGDI